jgi:hypothetical protein
MGILPHYFREFEFFPTIFPYFFVLSCILFVIISTADFQNELWVSKKECRRKSILDMFLLNLKPAISQY